MLEGLKKFFGVDKLPRFCVSELMPKRTKTEILSDLEELVYFERSKNPDIAHITIASGLDVVWKNAYKRYTKKPRVMVAAERIEYYTMVKKILDENKDKPVAEKLVKAAQAYGFALGVKR